MPIIGYGPLKRSEAELFARKPFFMLIGSKKFGKIITLTLPYLHPWLGVVIINR